MIAGIRGLITVVLALALSATAQADPVTYEHEFATEVAEFANLNRLNLARLNRDVHANCFISVTIATTIRGDGSVKEVSVEKSSTVPVVDRYFAYVIEQAAPYQPLANHYAPAPDEITITREFILDVQLWGHGIRSTEPCEKLKPRAPNS